MIGILTRYRALPVRERRQLWPAAWRLIVIRLSLLGSIQGTRQRFSGRPDCRRTLTDPKEARIWEMRATALRRVGDRIPGVHCLARSLALRWWMRSHGIDADSIIGVRSHNGQVESHAWVEVAGQAFNETTDVARLYRVLKTGLKS